MRHVTVAVMVPGTRAEHVREGLMPFLGGLARHGLSGSVQSPPGLARRTALFTGQSPARSGRLAAFEFEPRQSPYGWLRWVAPGTGLVRPRHPVVPTRRLVAAVTRWLSGAHSADPAWVPLRFLPYLRPVEGHRPVDAPQALGAPSLFDACRHRGLRHVYLESDAADAATGVSALVRALRGDGPLDLAVLRLDALARASRGLGASAAALAPGLRALDGQLASIHAALAARSGSWDLVVCGEHGMAPVTRTVDLPRHLARVRARPGRDYVVVLHDTLAAFWGVTERGRRVLEAVLPGIEGARLVGLEERRVRGLPVSRRSADHLLVAEPGHVFAPCQFQPSGSVPRAAAGYLDGHGEGEGALVVASSDEQVQPHRVGSRSLLDLLPTLCDLVAARAPPGHEGRSLLAAPRDATPHPAPRDAPAPASPLAQVVPDA